MWRFTWSTPQPRCTRTARYSGEDGGSSSVAADDDGVGDADCDSLDGDSFEVPLRLGDWLRADRHSMEEVCIKGML